MVQRTVRRDFFRLWFIGSLYSRATGRESVPPGLTSRVLGMEDKTLILMQGTSFALHPATKEYDRMLSSDM